MKPLSGVHVMRTILEPFKVAKSLRTYYTHKDDNRMAWLGEDHTPRYLREMNKLFKDLKWEDAARLDMVIDHMQKGVKHKELVTQLEVFKMKQKGSGMDDDKDFTWD